MWAIGFMALDHNRLMIPWLMYLNLFQSIRALQYNLTPTKTETQISSLLEEGQAYHCKFHVTLWHEDCTGHIFRGTSAHLKEEHGRD